MLLVRMSWSMPSSLPPRWFSLLLLLLPCTGQASDAWTVRRSVQVKLTPFQILYISDDNENRTDTDARNDVGEVNVVLEPMMLLEETRDHLTLTEFSKQSAFESLQLYQTVRSESPTGLFSNGTQVAFGGQATFSQLSMTSQEMLDEQYMSFLGANETAYVDRLRRKGWLNLRRALLMTATGGMINFDNGTGTMMMMGTNDEGDDAVDASRTMEKGMSNLIVSLATIIPVAILSLVAFMFVGYALRTKIHWKQLVASSNDSAVWHSSIAPKANAAAASSSVVTNNNNNDNSTASSGSVVVNIHDNRRREPTMHPKLLRLQAKAARAADKV